MQKLKQWLKIEPKSVAPVIPEITADLICKAYKDTGLEPCIRNVYISNNKTCAIGALYKYMGDGSGYPYVWMTKKIGDENMTALYRGFDGSKESMYKDNPYYKVGIEAAKRMGLE